MTDRTVNVRLRAVVEPYVQAIGRARASTVGLSRDLTAAAHENTEGMRQLGVSAGIAAGLVTLGIGKTVSTWSRFSKEISGVGAVADATGREMDRLADAAIAAGASTKLAGVTARDAASAETELARAGVSVADILGGALTGTLSLASAAQIDFGDSALLAAQAMKIFGLNGRDVGHIADVYAAAANKSAADIGSLGQAMRQGGLVASQLNIGLEDTVGTLALFADNALVGSDAGTSLKTLLQRLAPQSKEAAGEMERLGFSAFDAAGNFVGMAALADELQTSFGGLTQQQRLQSMTTIFGSDAIRGANVLFTAGAGTVRDYAAAVDDQGAAARMAAKQVDNLAGDIEAFGGAVEGAMIRTGEQSDGMARTVVQGAANVVAGYSALPPAAQQATLGVAGVSAATLGGVAALGVLVPRLAEAKRFLDSAGTGGQFLSRNLGTVAKVAGGAAIGMGVLSDAMGKSARLADELVASLTADLDTTSVDSINATLGDVQARLAELDAQWDNDGGGGVFGTLAKTAKGAIEVLTPLENSVLDNVEATKRLRITQEDLARIQHNLSGNSAELQNKLGLTAAEVEHLARVSGVDLAGAYGEVVPALTTAFAAMGDGTAITDQLAGATEILGSEVTTAEDRLKAYRSALDAVFNAKLGVATATDQLTSSTGDFFATLADAEGANRGYALSLDALTEAGLDARDGLVQVVQNALDLAEAMVAAGDSPTVVAMRMVGFRDSLVDAAVSAGGARGEVEYLTAALLDLPTNTGVSITANADQAIATLNNFIARVSQIPNSIQSTISALEEHDAVRFRNLLTISRPSLASPITNIPRAASSPTFRSGTGSSGGGGSSAADDAARAAEEAARAIEEWTRAEDAHWRRMYEHGEIDLPAYEAHLARRLAAEQQFSEDYFAILDEQQRVRDQHADDVEAWNEAVARNEREAIDLYMTTAERQYEAGELSRKRYREMLEDRLADLEKWGDEWWDTWQRIAAIDDEVARDSERNAEERKRATDQALDRLNRLLEQERTIRGQLADLAVAHTDRLRQVDERYNADLAKILDDRAAELVGWADITERVQVKWSSSVRALGRNVRDQARLFEEWTDALADARRRGVSDEVIRLLGLDQGPQALGQLRAFTSATQAEIDELNAAVEERTRQAADQVAREQGNVHTRVGRLLTDLAARHAAEVEELLEDFLARQRDLTDELEHLGEEQGLSYGKALEAGLRSAIPGIRAAVQEVIDAMNAGTNAGGGGGGGATVPGTMPPPNYQLPWVGGPTLPSPGVIRPLPTIPGMPERGIRFGSYDSGGYLPLGWSLAYNGTGRPEPVGHAMQAPAAAPVVHIEGIFIGGKPIRDEVQIVLRDNAGQRSVVGKKGG